jgi:hypothetical protein
MIPTSEYLFSFVIQFTGFFALLFVIIARSGLMSLGALFFIGLCEIMPVLVMVIMRPKGVR